MTVRYPKVEDRIISDVSYTNFTTFKNKIDLDQRIGHKFPSYRTEGGFFEFTEEMLEKGSFEILDCGRYDLNYKLAFVVSREMLDSEKKEHDSLLEKRKKWDLEEFERLKKSMVNHEHCVARPNNVVM